MLKKDSDQRCNTFVRLMAGCEHRIEGCVLALVPNWEDAEDIIQETKLRLWQQFDEYDPTKDFGTWACVIARYQVASYRQRSNRSRLLFSLELIDRLSEDLAEIEKESGARLALLQQCMKKLSDWQRSLLSYCYSSGRRDSRDVASHFGRKPGTIRQILVRIRRTLHRCIEEAEHKEVKRS